MTTYEYLRQLTNIDRFIEDKLNEARRWYSVATSMGSTDYSADRVQTSHSGDKMANAVVNAMDCVREANERANQLIFKKRHIISEIDGLSNPLHYNLLKGYFLNGKTKTELCVEEHYGRTALEKHFKRALEEFEEMYGERYLSNSK